MTRLITDAVSWWRRHLTKEMPSATADVVVLILPKKSWIESGYGSMG